MDVPKEQTETVVIVDKKRIQVTVILRKLEKYKSLELKDLSISDWKHWT